MSTIAAIKIPSPRAEQFRAIAAARRITITALVERVIADAIAAGEIGPDLPGFTAEGFTATSPEGEANRGQPFVCLAFGATQLPNVDGPMAGMVANLIQALAITRGADAGQEIQLGDFVSLKIVRKGNGIILAIEVHGHDEAAISTLSFSMALDLVRMIRRAYAAALELSVEEVAELDALSRVDALQA